jgi:protein-export membrane protein SecD
VLNIPAWWRYTTLLILAVGILVALPNALPEHLRQRLPSWMPNQAVTLGLDLQGGSYLLLEVDLPAVQRDRAEALMGDIGASLRRAGIGISGLEAVGTEVRVTINDTGRYAQARQLITDLNPTLAVSLVPGTRNYAMQEPGNGRIVLRPTDAFAEQTRQQILQQSVEVVRRRIDELGTREPSIAPQLPDRIVVEVPGLGDPAQLKEILGKTAKMTFHLVDEASTTELVGNPSFRPPIGTEILPEMQIAGQSGGTRVVVQRRVSISGDRLVDASVGFDDRSGQPAVTTRFDSVGGRQMADMTRENVGRRFAIVLDGQVLSWPTINEPILGGSAQISGSFTTQAATNLSVLLRAGALPAPLHVIEERTVGAELGADSVRAGIIATIAGLSLVLIFMFLRYGLFGIFANIALTLNLILLLATLTPLATLTLPGIAGIVLTLGMAIDANVLIFERIREELRNGRGMLAAIDQGFARARATIVDANMTHLIAALILFELGSGPIRGFAVALGLGIATSFFTAVSVTRLIVVTWLNVAKPRKIVL